MFIGIPKEDVKQVEFNGRRTAVVVADASLGELKKRVKASVEHEDIKIMCWDPILGRYVPLEDLSQLKLCDDDDKVLKVEESKQNNLSNVVGVLLVNFVGALYVACLLTQLLDRMKC